MIMKVSLIGAAEIACHDGYALGDGIGQDEFHSGVRLNRGEKKATAAAIAVEQ